MPKTSASKLQALRENGTLNPTPESVRDAVFAESVFFDPNDLLQVKYEMLRALEVDGQSIAGTAEAFGVSRPTVYEAKANFETKGLLGLLPEKRGPKHPHKLTPEVMKVVARWILEEPEIDSSTLATRVKERWRVTVHPRTIEKALAREAKRGRPKK
jgi:transposase